MEEKLVRDRIPDIIKENGERPRTERLNDNDVKAYIVDKVEEETSEFLESEELEELADLVEVMRRYLAVRDCSWQELEELRRQKKQERGGFEENIVLKDVD